MKLNTLLALLLFMFILIGGFSYTYISLNKPEEKKSFVVKHDDDFNDEPEEVIEKTVVIKNIYVNDYSGYADSEESASYWYVQYRCKNKADGQEWKGYGVYELNTPYFDVNKIRKMVWDGYTGDDYVEISFFQRVQLGTYKAFHNL